MSQRREGSLLYLIKRIELAVRGRLDALLEGVGLTAVQYTALTSLERHPDMTAAALARHSFVTAQTTAQLVRTLEARGLVERHPDPRSRRQALLALTPAGQRLVDGLREPVAAIEREMTAGLDAGELAIARRALASFRDALDA